jgi:hypothetical protein
MPKTLYCWRCDMELPMLDEEEWAGLAPLLRVSLENIQAYRERYQTPLNMTPKRAMYSAALARYLELTGFEETNPAALWHHRLSLYGPPCTHCGKPLRPPPSQALRGLLAPKRKAGWELTHADIRLSRSECDNAAMSYQPASESSTPDTCDLLIEARYVVPIVPHGVVLEQHAVAIRDGVILAVLPIADARARFEARETVSRPEGVLIPGLVNAHCHNPTTCR